MSLPPDPHEDDLSDPCGDARRPAPPRLPPAAATSAHPATVPRLRASPRRPRPRRPRPPPAARRRRPASRPRLRPGRGPANHRAPRRRPDPRPAAGSAAVASPPAQSRRWSRSSGASSSPPAATTRTRPIRRPRRRSDGDAGSDDGGSSAPAADDAPATPRRWRPRRCSPRLAPATARPSSGSWPPRRSGPATPAAEAVAECEADVEGRANLAELEIVDISLVSESGNDAVVAVTGTVDGETSTEELPLQRADGAWMVASLG